MADSPVRRLKNSKGKEYTNPNYIKQEEFEHFVKFISKYKYRYYVDKFSKLVLKTKDLYKKGTDNVSFFLINFTLMSSKILEKTIIGYSKN